MNSSSNFWLRPRRFVVCLLILSLLGPVSSQGLFPALKGFCFVDDSGSISKSIFQLFDEGKAGEERTEEDSDDEFEKDELHGVLTTSSPVAASLFGQERSGEPRSDPFGQVGKNLPIYLAHHALLI